MASSVVLYTDKECHFCKIKENNKLKYGPLYEINRIVAHYYCVLLSTQMRQNGKDHEGIMGFLYRDISLELRRSKNACCVYCGRNNATVHCAHHSCKKVFHYPCGLEAGALARFRRDFVSYCSLHRPRQKIPKKVLREALKSELICTICYDSVDAKDRINNLWAPCCSRTWYHKECVQSLANSSGYFFRCATCNDARKFKTHMEDNGVFVPLQDASWELVPNAYEELLLRYNKCDAKNCRCPTGREENVEDTRWEITLCHSCGSQGIHVGCGDLKSTERQWECDICQSIIKTDSNSTEMEDEAKDDLDSSQRPSTSNDQPSCSGVSRKRKLSDQAEVEKQRKRERYVADDTSDDSSDDEPLRPPLQNDSDDEFYIRIPRFVTTARKNERPRRIKKSNENVDVDVISMDTAWLMVEEVLSRVKPAPLAWKLRFLKKKCFSFHFDPFDVREEPITINLVSNSENDKSKRKVNSVVDESPDVEIIAEMWRGDKGKCIPEPEKMDSEPTEEHQEGQQLPAEPIDTAEAPEEPELIDLVDEPDDFLYNSEESQEQEMGEILDEPDVYPSTSGYGREFESLVSEDSDVEMSPCITNDQRLDFHYDDYRTDCEFEGQEHETSDDESDEEQTSRQTGKKYARRRISYYYRVKKPRMTVENQRGFAKPVAQHPNPTEPSTSRQALSGYSTSAPAGSTAQTFGNKSNVTRAVSHSGYRVGGAPSSIFLTNAPVYVYDISNATGQPNCSASMTPTPSTSGLARNVASNSSTCEPSTSNRWNSSPSIPTLPEPSSSSVPTTGGCFVMNECQPSSSGVATPLPTFQFLTNLRPAISPLLSSQSSNSSNSISLVLSRRMFNDLDTSYSDDSGSDVFVRDSSDVEKSAS